MSLSGISFLDGIEVDDIVSRAQYVAQERTDSKWRSSRSSRSAGRTKPRRGLNHKEARVDNQHSLLLESSAFHEIVTAGLLELLAVLELLHFRTPSKSGCECYPLR